MNSKPVVDQAAVAMFSGELPAGEHDYRATWRQVNLQLFNNAEEETAVRLTGSYGGGTCRTVIRQRFHVDVPSGSRQRR
jgi:hypothetical protein